MMIETIVSMARYLSARHDDDLVDRMNYLYTPNMLLVFSVLISFKQFGGRPLECMFPNKFPGSWEQYAENFCWSEDTYYLPSNVHVATVPENERYSTDRKLSYYQWVPFFLLLQAACFRFPSFLWKCFNLSSGIRVHEIVSQAIDPSNMDEKSRQILMNKLALHIGRALRFQSNFSQRNVFVHKVMSLLNVTYSTCFISFVYLFIKILYIINIVGQLYFMNRFLETDKYEWYGFDVIRDVMKGVPWQASGYFPRVSLCDFTVRQVANIQRYTVQCVLIINIFNEKIFLLLWFWYSLLFVCTVLSIFFWFFLIVFSCLGRIFVSHNLELNDNFDRPKHQKRINKFVNEYLRQDGVFVLRMIGMHAGILFNSELIMYLYKMYCAFDNQIIVRKKLLKKDIDAECNQNYVNNLSESIRKRKDKLLTKQLSITRNSDDVGVAFLPIAKNQSKSSVDSNKSNYATDKRRSKSDDSSSVSN